MLRCYILSSSPESYFEHHVLGITNILRTSNVLIPSKKSWVSVGIKCLMEIQWNWSLNLIKTINYNFFWNKTVYQSLSLSKIGLLVILVSHLWLYFSGYAVLFHSGLHFYTSYLFILISFFTVHPLLNCVWYCTKKISQWRIISRSHYLQIMVSSNAQILHCWSLVFDDDCHINGNTHCSTALMWLVG